MKTWIINLCLCIVFMGSAKTVSAQNEPIQTPSVLLDKWVTLWTSYDLNLVEHLFIRDNRLTYFSSETKGLIRGFEAVVEHHRGLGLEAGGAERTNIVWVRDTNIVDFGSISLIGAIWYFGDPSSPETAEKGPMSLLAVETENGYRIGHMHFATYPNDTE